MKTHLILAENMPSMKKAVSDTEAYLREFNVRITTERRDVDISKPEAYDTTGSWSGLIFGQTKSISSQFILGLANAEAMGADCIGLMVDKAKALFEDDDLAGQQHTVGSKQVIEVYCKGGKKNRYGMPDDTYVLVHELLHALADHYNVHDGLHAYVDKNPKNLDAYKEIFLSSILGKDGLYPAAQQAFDLFLKDATAEGLPFRITEGYRSGAKQNEYYAQPRDGKDNDGDGRVDEADEKITNAKAGESMHQFRIAADIYPLNGYEVFETKGKRLAQIAKKHGLYSYGAEEGYDWPHFQFTLGLSERQVRAGKLDLAKLWELKTIPVFTRDLSINSEGEDVRALQQFLNRTGYRVAWFGAGAPGFESTNFGTKTQAALIAFQKAHGITPTIGYFGAKTRAVLRSTYKIT